MVSITVIIILSLYIHTITAKGYEINSMLSWVLQILKTLREGVIHQIVDVFIDKDKCINFKLNALSCKSQNLFI